MLGFFQQLSEGFLKVILATCVKMLAAHTGHSSQLFSVAARQKCSGSCDRGKKRSSAQVPKCEHLRRPATQTDELFHRAKIVTLQGLSSMLEAGRMPKRSNQFQQIVTYIADELAPLGAAVKCTARTRERFALNSHRARRAALRWKLKSQYREVLSCLCCASKFFGCIPDHRSEFKILIYYLVKINLF